MADNRRVRIEVVRPPEMGWTAGVPFREEFESTVDDHDLTVMENGALRLRLGKMRTVTLAPGAWLRCDASLIEEESDV